MKPSEALFSPVSCKQGSSLHDLPWVPKGRFQQLLIKGGAAMKPSEARLKGPEKLIKIKRPPEMRLRQCRPCSTLILSETPPLNHCYKTLIKSSPVGTHSFSRQEPYVFPFAWQSNKAILFYFTQNSVSEIWFGTSVQRGQAFGNTIKQYFDDY